MSLETPQHSTRSDHRSPTTNEEPIEMDLKTLGWNSFFHQHFEPYREQGLLPARVSSQHREAYRICCAEGELIASVPARFRDGIESPVDFPTVGDWVAVQIPGDTDPASICAVLPRQSKFARRAAGDYDVEQLIAVNVDVLFLVNGLDGDFNIRRIERYVALAWDSGSNPVVLLNKADLCDDVEARIEQVEAIAIGLSVLPVSAETGDGLDEMMADLPTGTTAALVGSSGVGKSSIVNRLLGKQHLAVNAVREDDHRGRHTTSHRELLVIPGGGLIIDTPGMRELRMWGDDTGLQEVFGDVEELASTCRFGDCTHQHEPGCAVQAAITRTELDPGRLHSYLSMKREFTRLARKRKPKEGRMNKEEKRRDMRRSRHATRSRLGTEREEGER